MTSIKDAILAKASAPVKAVTKVVAVRLSEKTHAILTEQAELAGIKPCDIVRAAIDAFCESTLKD